MGVMERLLCEMACECDMERKTTLTSEETYDGGLLKPQYMYHK